MGTRQKYSPWIAALLLGLYAFIATPVLIWHQHNYEISSTGSDTGDNNDSVKSYNKTVDTNCQVCSHHYSVYASQSHTIITVPSSEYVVIKSFHLYSFPTEPYFHSTGRGPPAA